MSVDSGLIMDDNGELSLEESFLVESLNSGQGYGATLKNILWVMDSKMV